MKTKILVKKNKMIRNSYQETLILGKTKSLGRSAAPGSWPGIATWMKRALGEMYHDLNHKFAAPFSNILHAGILDKLSPGHIR